MKKILAILLSVLFVVSLCACGKNDATETVSSKNTSQETTAVVATESTQDNTSSNESHWVAYVDNPRIVLPASAQTAFSQAVKSQNDMEYYSVAYLGSKETDNGTEYAVLCQGKKSEDDSNVSLYVAINLLDLDGVGTMVRTSDFNLEEHIHTNNPDYAYGAGSWSAPLEVTEGPIPEDARAAYDIAISKKENADNIIPLILIGTKLDDEAEYAILCWSNNENKREMQVLVVHSKLDGTSYIKDIHTLDLDLFE